MNHYLGILTAIAFTLILITGITGCSSSDTTNPMTAKTDSEESTVQLTLDETYDYNRNGAHLIISYDAATNSFKGTVKNTTNGTLTQVRVEVHLSNGVELGPTTPVDLAPSEQIPVELMAEGPTFDMWTAHPEVGPSSGGGGEGGGEHGQGGHN
ncbi:MAG: hypothetical protein OXU23_00545 [Candidatus Poribacteria bacterium]|nr:hypothetical protein [Candidatus Poribacteria bacterium]